MFPALTRQSTRESNSFLMPAWGINPTWGCLICRKGAERTLSYKVKLWWKCDSSQKYRVSAEWGGWILLHLWASDIAEDQSLISAGVRPPRVDTVDIHTVDSSGSKPDMRRSFTCDKLRSDILLESQWIINEDTARWTKWKQSTSLQRHSVT